MTRRDPHSYCDSSQPQIDNVDIRWAIDFDHKKIQGSARLTFDRPNTGSSLDLDTRDLVIEGVWSPDGLPLKWRLHEPEPVLGSRLEIELEPGCRAVEITYSTSPDASALQWLDRELTSAKTHPFLFSQCQPHHARSILPVQDSPSVRFRFTAEIEAPESLSVVMAAAPANTCAGTRAGIRCHRFEMPQPIPAYLLALAVGRLEAQDISRRSRVYAEPEFLDAAAWEFAQVEQMIEAAEVIFGPYLWDRFDFVVMPRSFPYGGMENPRLTFLTPTLLTGDRSNVNVLAHELAHSWTGNLVTNASMDDFWLNEGFTVWAERRILERLKGEGAAELAACIGRRGLDRAVADFAERPDLTKLRTDLRGLDPDEVFSVVPYEKGYLFIRLLEQHLGRDRFAQLVSAYIDKFQFKSITTDDFTAFVEAHAPGVLAAVDADSWIDGPGVPTNAPSAHVPDLEIVARAAAAFPHESEELDRASAWSPELRLLFLEALPRPMPNQDCACLEALLGLDEARHCDVVCEWLSIAAASAYEPAFSRIEAYLGSVGRLKLLRPVYAALCRNDATCVLARRWFERVSDSYHPIARAVLGRIIAAAAQPS